jgi:hypothetical protein
MTTYDTILWGIISRLIASVIFTSLYTYYLFQSKPRIAISPQIAVTNNNGLLTYRIKVINYCKCSIIDIRGELSYVTISPNNGRIVTKQIHLNKSNL